VIDPLILARTVHIAATVLTSGTVCFMTLVAEPAASGTTPSDFPALRRRFTVTVWIALAVAILSGLGWLVLLAADIYGAPIVEVCLDGGAWQVATDTRFGMVWCARLMLGLALGGLMLWPAARWLVLGVAALLISLLALIGHAGASPGVAGRVHLVSDMVHLLAAGAWLGGLPAFALLLATARRNSATVWSALAIDATSRFSLLGIVSVAALLASGAVNSWNLLAGPRDLLTTDYGRLVLLKIGLFGAMVGIAAVNRYHLTPRLPAAMRALQRNSLCESGLGLCILLFVGVLGTLAPSAHIHTPSSAIPPGAAFVHIHDIDAMAEVTIDPGRAGWARITIRVEREDFTEFPVKDVRLALDPPVASLKPLERAAEHMADGTWMVDRLEIAQSGIWTVRVIVVSGAGKSIVLDAPVMIDR
jgi:copper resistance protein D